ncbi:response regulator [Tundrisphaera lichenicola]|uniref:response regulator n=1 Tax=Tundrisphaera lichenicola TaxID=2029860 RepID=UPI003EBCE747
MRNDLETGGSWPVAATQPDSIVWKEQWFRFVGASDPASVKSPSEVIRMDSPMPLDILVVKKAPGTRADLLDLLRREGHRIETARSDSETLGRRDLEAFSTIILDHEVPGEIAEPVLPRLRQATPGTPIILMTNRSDLQRAIEAIRQGATDYITRPLVFDVLRFRLAKMADRRQLAMTRSRREFAFQQLVEAADWLIIITRPDQSILYINPFAEPITRFSVHDVIGDSHNDQSCSDEAGFTLEEFANLVLNNERIRDYEWTFRCRNGSRRSIVWNARRLDEYQGGPAILGVEQDNTELKRAQSVVLRSERLSAIGQMATGLAHESRNALQRGQACLEMLALSDRD